ncbi:MAG: hypothetical protein ABI402_17525 [Ferruginibacter sp.]
MPKNLHCLLYLAAIVSLTNCKSMKFSFSERIVIKNSYQKIELVKNQPIIVTQLEGKDQRLMLDLGSTACLIYDTTVISDYYKREKSSMGNAKGAGTGKIKMIQLHLSINDSLFSSPNKVFIVVDNPALLNKANCSPGEKIAGLYGANLFKMNKTILLLDLQEKRLCNLTNAAFTNTIADGYQEIKSKFNLFGIKLYVLIHGKEYPFGFDTGFNGSFIMPADKNIDFATEPHVSFEGMIGITVTGVEKGLTDLYEGTKISMNGKAFNSTISVSSSIKAQNMGMAFIKGFNWIIDYKHKKVYYKSLAKTEQLNTYASYNYVATILDNKLLVATRKVGMNDYNIADEIISVNGQTVNDNNKCELLEMLIKNNDWKALDVKTQSVVIQ